MSSDHHIRQATLDDLGTIVRHRRMMFADIGHGDPVLLKAAEPAYTEWLRERMENGRYQGWFMAAADGTVLAGGPLVDGMAPRRAGPCPLPWLCLQRLHGTRPPQARLLAEADASTAGGLHGTGLDVVGLHASPEGRPLYAALGFEDSNEMRMVLPTGSAPPGPR